MAKTKTADLPTITFGVGAFDWCIGAHAHCECPDCWARTQRRAARKAGR
jgi:hypothetical protein